MSGVIVIQKGARHRYAVPRMLEANAMLAMLITDSHANSRLGCLAGILARWVPVPASLLRLRQRLILGVPASKIVATDRWFLADKKIQKYKLDHKDWLDARDKKWHDLIRDISLPQADILYSMGAENHRMLLDGKRSGMKIILDVFINPMNWRQTFQAKSAVNIHPNKDEADHAELEAYYRALFDTTDIILCPSTWVADGVKELSPEQAHKIRICPYGSSLPPSGVSRAPVPGRIFWAGGDWFRKGLHHLAAAADLALKQEPEMEFRIAGITDPLVISKPEFRNLRFLGKLDKKAMQEEFAKADLFVLPTLTEGMASVLVEAITAGCPVLTTRGAGFDGLEESGAGRIFEAADASGLASHLVELTRDRAAIGAMNEACTRFAPNFTEDAWARRLIPVLKELADRKPKS